jgi:mannose-6-phosphate isomerase
VSALLPTREVEKPWGKDALPAPFSAPEGRRIGEIWFEPPEQVSELLVKYIFTSEALSVQVHPSDAQTMAKGLGRQGKEECWLILDAQPGAKLGMGFREHVSPETMRAAALDGSIEQMLHWHDVAPGDFFYIPANTVHAIGAGISLIEVQQNSDITYRLYDYGRPRELHLDEGVAVSKGEPYPVERYHAHVPARGSMTLADGPLFLLDQVAGAPSGDVASRYAGPLLVIPREGEVRIAGEAIAPGNCGLAARLSDVDFADNIACLLARACAVPE